MKTQLLSAVLVSVAILTGTFAYSSNAKPIKTSTKEIAITSPFQKITVGNNLQLVLIQDESKSAVLITGDDNLLKFVKVSVNKGVLSIASNRYLGNRNIKIYVPVSTLASLDLASGASVATEGIVKLENLKVFVREDCKVNLHILGNFQLESDDDCDIVYQKYEKYNVVFVHE
ncbi:MAG: DUF2807 domain-containing protein [Ginsengibacter sp.]